MQVIEKLMSIRDRFVRREVEKVAEKESTWDDIKERLADGKDVPYEEIEKVVDSARMSAAITCPSGCQSEVLKTKRLSGKTECQCRSCGREFVAEDCSDSVGEWSVERLARDVEILIKAREDLANAKRLPELLAEQRRLRVLDEAEVEKLRQARIDCDKAREELQSPILLNAAEIEEAKRALNAFRGSYASRHPAAAKELELLQNSRGKVAMRSQNLRQELFGHGAASGTVEPFTDTVGLKWLSFLTKHFSYTGGPLNLKKVDPHKNSSIALPAKNGGENEKHTWEEFIRFHDTKIVSTLAEIERCDIEVKQFDAQIAEKESAVLEI